MEWDIYLGVSVSLLYLFDGYCTIQNNRRFELQVDSVPFPAPHKTHLAVFWICWTPCVNHFQTKHMGDETTAK